MPSDQPALLVAALGLSAIGLAAAARPPGPGSMALAAPLELYHGGRWKAGEQRPRVQPLRLGHAEHGPGIYGTTSAALARKHARGGGRVSSFELRQGTMLLQDSVLSLADAVAWMENTPGLRHRAVAILDLRDMARRRGHGDTIPAMLLLDALAMHESLARAAHGPALAAYLASRGIEAHVDMTGEIVAVFDPRAIVRPGRLHRQPVDDLPAAHLAPPSPSALFLQGWKALYPFDRDPGARVSLRADREAVIIDGIAVMGTRHGKGTRILEALCHLADQLGVTLHLVAEPYWPFRERGPGRAKLIAWYRRHGFRCMPRGRCTRRPAVKG